MSEKIGVLGCGWLGLPLAKRLLQDSYKVFGTTTSEEKLNELQKEGIRPFQIRLSPTAILGDIQGFLSQIDVLIINVPPRLRGKNTESFVDKTVLLHSEIKKSGLTKVIFVSSTAVYGDLEGEVNELTPIKPTTESGKQLMESEQLFGNDPNLSCTIIRFGGLIGPDRHPVTMLSQKTHLTNGNDPVNLIHLEDCIHMILTILENQYWGELFNGVNPFHPSKSDYYGSEAAKRGLPPLKYQVDPTPSRAKVVISQNFLDKGHAFTTSIIS
ncbi:SDR family oxidoreductase [Muricauda sp. CAU 1633]|uniref:SDR family oxidoreductase n=1 Tax=Allomuricauda sp. CAU 1633 TaxID=2816036 RepID=UPI001A90700B|nr:SDR family oxidoreductase [Muricauda sp. CAU 1633]MBO0324361.1 SDR family oxidoreductase [Muricauda sp. CAU 1633]